MAHISLRVSDREKTIMEEYAKMHAMNLSETIKEAFFEKLEDELDLKSIQQFELNEKEGFTPFEDVVKNLGFEYEL
ncbi:hypothetical protein AwErysi_02130 [Erysipelotrichaceae bacterium]|nr:hypothetical protein AwErysi_02130 [Erysipelotrichaceae bacterium]